MNGKTHTAALFHHLRNVNANGHIALSRAHIGNRRVSRKTSLREDMRRRKNGLLSKRNGVDSSVRAAQKSHQMANLPSPTAFFAGLGIPQHDSHQNQMGKLRSRREKRDASKNVEAAKQGSSGRAALEKSGQVSLARIRRLLARLAVKQVALCTAEAIRSVVLQSKAAIAIGHWYHSRRDRSSLAMMKSVLTLQRAYRCVLFKLRLQKNKKQIEDRKENCGNKGGMVNRAALRTWTRHHCGLENIAFSTVSHSNLKVGGEEACRKSAPRHSRTSITIQSLLSEFSSQVNQAKYPPMHYREESVDFARSICSRPVQAVSHMRVLDRFMRTVAVRFRASKFDNWNNCVISKEWNAAQSAQSIATIVAQSAANMAKALLFAVKAHLIAAKSVQYHTFMVQQSCTLPENGRILGAALSPTSLKEVRCGLTDALHSANEALKAVKACDQRLLADPFPATNEGTITAFVCETNCASQICSGATAAITLRHARPLLARNLGGIKSARQNKIRWTPTPSLHVIWELKEQDSEEPIYFATWRLKQQPESGWIQKYGHHLCQQKRRTTAVFSRGTADQEQSGKASRSKKMISPSPAPKRSTSALTSHPTALVKHSDESGTIAPRKSIKESNIKLKVAPLRFQDSSPVNLRSKAGAVSARQYRDKQSAHQRHIQLQEKCRAERDRIRRRLSDAKAELENERQKKAEKVKKQKVQRHMQIAKTSKKSSAVASERAGEAVARAKARVAKQRKEAASKPAVVPAFADAAAAAAIFFGSEVSSKEFGEQVARDCRSDAHPTSPLDAQTNVVYTGPIIKGFDVSEGVILCQKQALSCSPQKQAARTPMPKSWWKPEPERRQSIPRADEVKPLASLQTGHKQGQAGLTFTPGNEQHQNQRQKPLQLSRSSLPVRMAFSELYSHGEQNFENKENTQGHGSSPQKADFDYHKVLKMANAYLAESSPACDM